MRGGRPKSRLFECGDFGNEVVEVLVEGFFGSVRVGAEMAAEAWEVGVVHGGRSGGGGFRATEGRGWIEGCEEWVEGLWVGGAGGQAGRQGNCVENWWGVRIRRGGFFVPLSEAELIPFVQAGLNESNSIHFVTRILHYLSILLRLLRSPCEYSTSPPG